MPARKTQKPRTVPASALALSCLWAATVFAANPQPYNPVIAPTGSAELDAALSSSSLLVSLKDEAPVPPFGLIERARGDIQRLVTALSSFGYYQPAVMITIAGKNLDDPELPPLLDAAPAGMAVPVNVEIGKGPLYRVGNVDLAGNPPPDARSILNLMPGQPAIAADILAAQARLLTALQEQGYAFADVQGPAAVADDMRHLIDLTFTVNPGEKAEIGRITFSGLMRARESYALRVLTVHTGDLYKPSAIEAARQALAAAGVFSGVTVMAADTADENGRVALIFDVQERPLRTVKLDGTYSTDLGLNFSAGWSHHDLFGNGEQLNLLASATGLWGSATSDIGYQLSAQFIKPQFLRNDQTLTFELSAIKQSLQAYNQRAETVGLTLQRKLPPFWIASGGIAITRDHVVQKGLGRTYQLLSLPLTAIYDTTGLTDPLTGLVNPLLDATHGVRASFAVTPIEAFGAKSPPFVVVQASGSTYYDVFHDMGSVIAMRGLVGDVLGASNLDLPPDQRLYAGGSPTVRGYRYQSIGPLFPDGDPIGATAVDAVTLELRQKVYGDFGAALFVDGGQASASGVPFTGTFRVGVGGGLRYYTPIGAIRADVAVPLNRPPGGDSLEIYVGLGQAF